MSPHRWVTAMNHSLTARSGCRLWKRSKDWKHSHDEVIINMRKSKDECHNRHIWYILYMDTHTHTLIDPSSWFGTQNKFLSRHLSGFFYEALRLHMRAIRLIPPPTNPSILMLVHIGLGHIKPMINDVLIGLFSTTEPRCWVDSTLAYLSHPACQRRMFPAGK